MRIGENVKVRVLRHYGPFLGKPDLPAGEYIAEVDAPRPDDAEDYGLLIQHDGHEYYVQAFDAEILS